MKEKNAIRISRMEKEKSEELNRDKMEFFTNISHELKTPLSLILAPLKYISQNQPLSEDSTKRLDVAIANTNKMVGLIDELVTFNRVESGNFQLYLQKGNPLTFIETMCSYFYEAADEKHISIHVSTENNGEDVWFSTTYLERVLYNLLSNAIKYTHEGGQINVRGAIKEGEDNNIYLYIEVRDTGIGISPSELDNIFKKYYQTKRGYNTNHQGWGIGLATVKKLVDIHKGSITVNSEIGIGSTFTVCLNVTPEAFDRSCRIDNSKASSPEPTYRRTINSGYKAPVNNSALTNSSERLSILIVEDNPELLDFLSDSFMKSYNVFTATNGVEALKVISEHQIDIVVSDVMMPEMDGITLCEKLKNDLQTSHIPVILLTAKNDEESIRRGFAAGAEAYVAKPFDPQILELRVQNILRSRRKFLNSIINPSSNEIYDTEEAVKEDDSDISPVLNDFDKDFIQKMNDYVELNLENSEFAVSDITREFSISRSLLHVKMKSLFNTSMTDFIRHKRMELACSLLKSGLNVSETAYKVGFSDPNYFSKVFKKEFGVTPSDYIANIENNS